MGSHCDLPLHGFTVVVETDKVLYIGRYHSESERGILLNDVDAHDVQDETEKLEYLAKSAKFGVFKNTDQVQVPLDRVSSVRKLIEYTPKG
ncbi:MAG: hypothetical protein DHS20C21_13440 [Gemmatimonadota bacterium]|nr:MAG: hypothetical protein DHS20C21_13440 [Gemmatimonadota bacterium]